MSTTAHAVPPASAPSRPPSRAHIPALDGLRGIAVLLVMVFHFARWEPVGQLETVASTVLRMGWVGVDLFFVLSGFLITGILLDTRGLPGYWRSFLGRRAVRILPLYYAVCLLIVAAVVAGSGAARAMAPWYFFYLPNVYIALRGGMENLLGMGHFWSLAVEEQFYLVWPFVVLWAGPRRLGRLCVGMIATALALRCAMVVAGVDTIVPYVLTITRMDSLAVGALLATVARSSGGLVRLRPYLVPVGAVAGLVAVGAMLVHPASDGYLQAWPASVGYTANALFFGSLLVAAILLPSTSLLGRVTESSVLRFFGKYSYGLYVFHYPLIAILDRVGLTPERISVPGYMIVATAVSVMIALASWYVWELPWQGLKRYFPSPADRSRA